MNPLFLHKVVLENKLSELHYCTKVWGQWIKKENSTFIQQGCIKGIVCPKMTLSFMIFHSSLEKQIKIFWWNLRAFWPCTDSNTTDTFKAQKGSKDIIKIVHVTSVVHQSWYSRKHVKDWHVREETIIVFVFFVLKKYSHSFIILRLNHWCHINNFNNVHLSGPWTVFPVFW